MRDLLTHSGSQTALDASGAHSISDVPSPALLWLEPNLESLSTGALPLLAPIYQVVPVKGYGELFGLRSAAVQVAVLADTLGPAVLRAVAERVRWQWPLARILILGRAQSVLEDHLYDDALACPCRCDKLMEAIVRLTADPWAQRAST